MKELKNFTLVCSLLFASQLAKAQLTKAPRSSWVVTWATSPQSASPDPDEPLLKIEDQTVRERVRVSAGGAQLRIRLSNEYGSTPLVIGAATVALPNGTSGVTPGSIHTVTFGGNNSVTIPAGAPILSDPVALPVTSEGEISISLYFPTRVATPTIHALALKHAVVSQRGDHTRTEQIEAGAPTESSILVTAVLVPAQPSQRLVVAFGDSVTDGDGSTIDADHNWLGDLARRLEGSPAGAKLAVANEGIAGNRLLSDGFGVSALARFDRDAIALPGVTHIVLLEGANDICFPGAKLNGEDLADPTETRTPDDVIGAYRQLIARAHAHGIRLIGATLTPFEGVVISGYYSEPKEAMRQAINKWIRTSGSFDGVIDFDAVVRDPEHPSRLSPRFASKDHLHPNDAGYKAMADSIDIRLLQ